MSKNKFYFKKVSLLFALVCILFSVLGVQAFATVGTCPHNLPTYGDYSMNGGVGQYGNYKRYYYINNGSGNVFNSWYTGWIRAGVDDWVHSTSSVGVTTSISIYETGVKSNAMFEFENDPSCGVYILGITEFYLYQNRIPDNDLGTRNWGWCKMRINCPQIDSYVGYDERTDTWRYLENYQKQSICMHEMGHALGLSHNTSSRYNIMYPYVNQLLCSRASADEYRLINHIYG